MEWPLVTVFTLIYNTNPTYVIEAIESIRANEYPNLQHIIIDDCSPNPEPKNVVKKWIEENNYPCEFYEHEVNYGLCKTLNHVLEMTKGKYIFGCSDDIISVNRIRTDVETFKSLNENYAIVFGLSQEMDPNSVLQPRVFPHLFEQPSDNYFPRLLQGNCLSAPSTTYRVSVLRKVGGFNENVKFEDYEINLRLASLGYKFKCIAKIQSFYRIHNESISNNLNFEIENLKILSQFSKSEQVKIRMYQLVFDMTINKRSGYQEAVLIFESVFGKSKKLRLLLFLRKQLLKRIFNKLFKLDSL